MDGTIHSVYDPNDNNYLVAEFNRYKHVEGAQHGKVRVGSEAEAESSLNPGDRCTIWLYWPAPGVSQKFVKVLSRALED
jgi:hypothetical protein